MSQTTPGNSLPPTIQARLVDNIPLVVVFLLLTDSLHFVFARLLLSYGLPPATSAMYVLGVATVEMVVISMIWGRVRFEIFRRYLWFFLGVGFLVAASTALGYASVAFIDPGTASLLEKTSILFGLGFGILWLRERFTRFESIGALVTITGAFIITFQPVEGDNLRLGALLILIAAFMYALHTALVKRYGANMSLMEFFLFRLLCTMGFLFLIVAGRGELVRPSWPAGLLLFIVGTLDVLVSRGLYYLALRRLKLTHHTLILTLSPVIAVGWTFLLFDVSPTLQQLIGGAAVLAGVLMVTVGRERITANT
jgi:drug/metabolite transporter (DMT)-like permease